MGSDCRFEQEKLAWEGNGGGGRRPETLILVTPSESRAILGGKGHVWDQDWQRRSHPSETHNLERCPASLLLQTQEPQKVAGLSPGSSTFTDGGLKPTWGRGELLTSEHSNGAGGKLVPSVHQLEAPGLESSEPEHELGTPARTTEEVLRTLEMSLPGRLNSISASADGGADAAGSPDSSLTTAAPVHAELPGPAF